MALCTDRINDEVCALSLFFVRCLPSTNGFEFLCTVNHFHPSVQSSCATELTHLHWLCDGMRLQYVCVRLALLPSVMPGRAKTLALCTCSGALTTAMLSVYTDNYTSSAWDSPCRATISQSGFIVSDVTSLSPRVSNRRGISSTTSLCLGSSATLCKKVCRCSATNGCTMLSSCLMPSCKLPLHLINNHQMLT